LGGALYLQKQEQQQQEAKKQADLATKQSQIDGLNSQVHFLRFGSTHPHHEMSHVPVFGSSQLHQ
jgi:hypothetical protein